MLYHFIAAILLSCVAETDDQHVRILNLSNTLRDGLKTILSIVLVCRTAGYFRHGRNV
jgi:hypothetical protein